MRTIHKYPIKATIEMPVGAQILKVDTQGLSPMLWAEVEDNASYETRYFDVYGTGWVVDETEGTKVHHVGTYLQGDFVWHVYERTYNE